MTGRYTITLIILNDCNIYTSTYITCPCESQLTPCYRWPALKINWRRRRRRNYGEWECWSETASYMYVSKAGQWPYRQSVSQSISTRLRPGSDDWAVSLGPIGRSPRSVALHVLIDEQWARVTVHVQHSKACVRTNASTRTSTEMYVYCPVHVRTATTTLSVRVPTQPLDKNCYGHNLYSNQSKKVNCKF